MRCVARAFLFLGVFGFVVASSLPACSGQVPSVIRDEIARTRARQPGSVTVVFFTDFQCPHCRKTHAALAPLLEARRGRVRVVLRHVPLPRHPDARTAARAAVCVEKLSPARALEYAHALFASPDLGEGACEDLALQHGAPRDAFQRCVADDATNARIDQDTALLDAASGDGVPLLYVGRTRLDGAQSRSALEAALEAEAP